MDLWCSGQRARISTRMVQASRMVIIGRQQGLRLTLLVAEEMVDRRLQMKTMITDGHQLGATRMPQEAEAAVDRPEVDRLAVKLLVVCSRPKGP